MLSLALSLLGIARKAAGALVDLVRRYPMAAALIVAVAASVWLWRGKEAEHAGRIAAEQGRAADREHYAEAQRQAAILARQAREAQERRYAEQAERADHDHAIELSAALDRTDRFIAANRVRPTGTVARPAGDTGSAAESHSAESGDGPGAASDLVAVSADDLRICTTNTTRLEAVREWALGL